MLRRVIDNFARYKVIVPHSIHTRCHANWNRVKVLLVIVAAMVQAVAFAQTDTDASYVLGSEDVFSVTVLRHPEFSGRYLVPTSGTVEIPAVGPVMVKGMSIADLSKLVNDQLSKRLRKPEVTVVLEIARPKHVSIIGTVARPGTYDMKPGWRVTELISMGGGIPPDLRLIDLKAYLLKAGTTQRVPLDLPKVLEGAPEANLAINEGDVVIIEGLDLMPVYVTGKVKAPGVYKLPSTSSGTMEAITLAGGVTPDAATTKVKIVRVATGKEEVFDITPMINGTGTVQLPKLSSGDMIVVPESDSKIAVFGYVMEPGVISLPEGKEVKLADAVAMAKPNDRSRLSRVALVRMVDGKEQRYQYDVGKFVNTGDSTQNPVVKSGDVIYIPETDKLDWSIIGNLGLIFRVFH